MYSGWCLTIANCSVRPATPRPWITSSPLYKCRSGNAIYQAGKLYFGNILELELSALSSDDPMSNSDNKLKPSCPNQYYFSPQNEILDVMTEYFLLSPLSPLPLCPLELTKSTKTSPHITISYYHMNHVPRSSEFVGHFRYN